MFPRWLFWPLFWAMMGFALGGSFVAAKPDEGVWNWITREAVGFFTLWVVIIAGGQLILFFWQLVPIRESLEDTKIAADAAKESADTAKIQAETAHKTLQTMQDTAKRQLRAYVTVTGIKILYADGAWQPNLRVTFKNVGQTPAHKVQNRFGYTFVLMGTPSFKLPSDAVSYPSLAPTQDVTTTALVTQAEWNTFKDGVVARAVKFFAYGEIAYEDTFGDPHFTRYRVELAPDGEGIKEDSFLFCPEGNESN